MCPHEYGRASAEGDIRAFVSVSMVPSYLLISGTIVLGCVSSIIGSAGTGLGQSFGTICLKMLHKLRKESNAVRLFVGSSQRIAPSLCDASLRRLGTITCLGY